MNSSANPLTEPASTRRSIRLELLAAVDGDAQVIQAKSLAPIFQGMAEADYLCASCGTVLCAGVGTGRLAGVVFRCLCGAVNRVPTP